MNTVQLFFICNSSNGITKPAVFALYRILSGFSLDFCNRFAPSKGIMPLERRVLQRDTELQRRGLRRGQTKRRMVQQDRRWRQKFQLFFLTL